MQDCESLLVRNGFHHRFRSVVTLLLAGCCLAMQSGVARAQEDLITRVRSAVISEDYRKAIELSRELIEKFPQVPDGYQNLIYASSQVPPPRDRETILFLREKIRYYQAKEMPNYDHVFFYTMKRNTYRWESALSSARGDFDEAIATLDRLYQEGDRLSRVTADVTRGGEYAVRSEELKSKADALKARGYLEAALSDKESLREIGGDQIAASVHYTLSLVLNNSLGDFAGAITNLEAALEVEPSNSEYKRVMQIVRKNQETGAIEWISIRELRERLGL